MEMSDFKNKTPAELQKLLRELREQAFSQRMARGQNQAAKPHLVRAVRKDIARVLTVLQAHKNK